MSHSSPTPPIPIKPEVHLYGDYTSVTESSQKLYDAIAPSRELFVRHGKVSELSVDVLGRPVFSEVLPAQACSLFEKYAQFKKPVSTRTGNHVWLNTTINKGQAELYLASPERLKLPVVRGLMHTPIATEVDGKVRVLPHGFDPATQLYIAGTGTLPKVTLDEAIDLLPRLLRDFHFQTAGDRSRALASLLTPALRFGRFIKGPIPMDVAEADQSQSGKTYRQQMVAALYGAKLYTVGKVNRGVGSTEEYFATGLQEGHPFIQFDNLRGSIDSQQLEAFLTASGAFSIRPAYSKTLQIDPFYHLIYLSSNDYKATIDLANRSSIVRIFKRVGHHFDDMLGFVEENQSLLLSFVFEIIKEWHRRGKLRTKETRHSFTEWAQTLDWIVQEIFGAAPLLDGHQEAQKRVSSTTASFVRSLILKVKEDKKSLEPLTARELVSLCIEHNIAVPHVAPEKRQDEAANQLAIGKVFKELFDGGDTHLAEGFKITRTTRKATGEIGKTFDMKTYTFEQTTGNSSPPNKE